MSTPRHSSSTLYIAKKISASALLSSMMLVSLAGLQVFAVTDSAELTQVINAPSSAVEIRTSTGGAVASPTVAFDAANYAYNCLTGDSAPTGTLPADTDRLYVQNGTDSDFTISIGASASTDVWDSETATYDFNDADACTDGSDTDTRPGQLTIDAGTVALTADYSGGTTTGLTAISVDSAFDEGTTDSIELLEGTDVTDTGQWYLTGIGLSQVIPALQSAGSYTLDMVVTYTALP